MNDAQSIEVRCEVCEKVLTEKQIREASTHRRLPRFCSKVCRGSLESKVVHPNLIENYFESIDTKEKAYWLGFIMADGCIREAQKCRFKFQLHLSRKDEDQMDRFITTVGLGLDSKDYHIKTNSVMISTRNRTFINHLISKGISPRKTLHEYIPDLGDKGLNLAFLLGLFDGDGSLKGKYYIPTLSSGAEGILIQINTIYDLNHKIQMDKKYIDGEYKGVAYTLCIGRPLHKEMIANYENSMPRKRDPKWQPEIKDYQIR